MTTYLMSPDGKAVVTISGLPPDKCQAIYPTWQRISLIQYLWKRLGWIFQGSKP